MISYNKKWLYALHVRKQADEALHEGLIDDSTHKAIYQKHPAGFYTPNFFVRVGLGLLAIVITVFGTGLLELMTQANGQTWIFVLTGVGCIAAAETIIQTKKHYNSGLDTTLVWLAAVFMWSAFLMGIETRTWYDNSPTRVDYTDVKLSMAGLVIAAALAIRYADMLLSIAATVCLILLVFFICQHGSGLMKNITPFILIVLVGAIYMAAERARKTQALLFYHNCLLCVRITALVAFYASGNFYMVNELRENNEVNHTSMGAIGWFFWAWTIALPLAYIAAGIRRRNIILVRVGIPLVAVAVLTFRYYHHVMAPEVALMLGGVVLIIVSYLLMKHLRTPKGGFTFQPETFVKDTPDIGRLITGELVKNAGAGTGQQQNDEWN
jgi:hypothetical protein